MSSEKSGAAGLLRRSKVAQFAILLVVVVALVTASIFFQQWWNNRPATDPSEITVTATVGGTEFQGTPYSMCEPGVECAEHQVIEVTGTGDLTLTLPEEVFDHDWALLKVYDDPALNTQDYFAPYEKKTITFPTTQDGAKLVVVEVATAMIGHDAQGEETPMTVTWSFHLSQ